MAPDDDVDAGHPTDENFDQALRFAHDLARFRAAATQHQESAGEKPPTLVLADDEPALRRLVRMTLSGEGYEVIEAGTGLEAMATIREHKPRLVLLDVGMPELSGLEICRLIRSDESLKDTWVIVLSGMGHPDDQEEGLRAGADAYLTKPFSPLQLLTVVEAGMARSA
jgi:DNA-binding response OmpR family regulator